MLKIANVVGLLRQLRSFDDILKPNLSTWNAPATVQQLPTLASKVQFSAGTLIGCFAKGPKAKRSSRPGHRSIEHNHGSHIRAWRETCKRRVAKATPAFLENTSCIRNRIVYAPSNHSEPPPCKRRWLLSSCSAGGNGLAKYLST